MSADNHMSADTSITAASHITDVSRFFATITEEYGYFERNVLRIIDTIPFSSLREIQAQCSEIGEQRDKLAIMDEQMFAIIDLAGSEIAHMPMVHTYRVAFAAANMACTNLYQKLQSLKISLEAGNH